VLAPRDAPCNGKIAPPRKGMTGACKWPDADLEAVKQALTVDRRMRERREALSATEVS
jgi:hypothetical protein